MNDLCCIEITRSDKIMANLRRNQGQDDSLGEQETNRNGKKPLKINEPVPTPLFYFPLLNVFCDHVIFILGLS